VEAVVLLTLRYKSVALKDIWLWIKLSYGWRSLSSTWST